MKNMQTKFFEELQSHLDDKREGELIVNFAYTNTGRGYIQRQNTFTNLSEFNFSFQTDYATFNINGVETMINFSKGNLIDAIWMILEPIADPAPLDYVDPGVRINGGDPACPQR